ncbi:MAG: hypothetical protein IOC90_08315 [Methylocystis sp.]|nr:hypothetical protein [Methylocystis sp.]MCA3584480.1 hypothetical protein [Methylocystis sp.]MCA3588021.1 hypothetical protein [Methylocystis sp.]MCA3590498.1 hypothetical protein [Methylocystis sp.]
MNDCPTSQSAQVTAAEDMPPQAAVRAPMARRKRSLWGRFAVAFVSLVMMTGIAVALAGMMLSRRPIEVDFLSERIASSLEQRIGAGVDVGVGRTVIEKSDGGLSLHIQNITIRNAAGREILRSPDAVVAFTPRQLLTFRLSPDRLALRGMALRAEITANNEILFHAGAVPSGPGSAPPQTSLSFQDIVSFVMGLGESGGLSALAIDDASLTVQDRRNGKEITFQSMALAFESAGDGSFEARGSLRKDQETVPMTVKVSEAEGRRRIEARISQLGNAVLHALLGAETNQFTLESKLSLGADVVVAPDGSVSDLILVGALGAGQALLPHWDDNPIRIDEATVRASWSAASPNGGEMKAAFRGGGAAITLAGPIDAIDGWGGPVRWLASGGQWALPRLAPDDDIVTVDKAEMVAAFTPSDLSLNIERLALAGPGTNLNLSAKIVNDAGLPGLHATAEARNMPIRNLLRWWPPKSAIPARLFLIDSVRGGELTRVNMRLAMPGPVFRDSVNLKPLPREAVDVEVAVENAVVALAPNVPLIAGIFGRGKLDSLSSTSTMSSGFVDVRPGQRIQLMDGTLMLTRLDTFTPEASFQAKSTAPLEALAEVLRLPGVRDLHSLDIDPANIRGQFEGDVTVSLPLGTVLTPANVTTEVNGKMTGVTIEKAMGRDRLENASFTISTDASGIDVKGEGRWLGVPVSLTLENDARDKSLTTVLTFTLDDAAMKRRGIHLGSHLTGPLPIKVTALKPPNGVTTAAVEIDLTKAAIDGLFPGFQKPAGRPGRASFDVQEKPTGFSVQNFVIESGVSAFRGQAELLTDGTVNSAKFSLFRVSPGDNVRLDFDRQGATSRVVIRGNNLDARPFLRVLNQGDTQRKDPDKDVDIDIKTTLLSGHGGEVMTGADVRVIIKGGQLRQLNVGGRINAQPLTITSRPVGDSALVTIESDDAGAFFRYLDLYSRMYGGDLTAQITPASTRISGFMIARNFTLRNEPALRRLVAESGPDQQRVSVTDTQFTKMRIDFSREGTETIIKDAVIFGNQLGLTFNGVVDQARDRISLSGTYVPAYGLNNAFSQIPLFGSLLGGGRNEGLLAVTFGVAGRASQPIVTVNPLSAVAPGIFRKIFEFRNETTVNPLPRGNGDARSSPN